MVMLPSADLNVYWSHSRTVAGEDRREMSISQWLDPQTFPHLYQYVAEINGHHCGVRKDCDWGGPCDWRALCACGWAGSLFTDSSHPGERSYGTYLDALAELLVHTGFDPAERTAQLTAMVAEAMRRLRELSREPVSAEDLDAMEKLVVHVRAAREEHERLLTAWERRNQ